MTNRVAELGTVESVEMEMAHAAGVELATQFRSDSRGDQLTCGWKVVETLEQRVEPLRYAGAAKVGEAAGGGDVGYGQDAWNDLGLDTRRGCLVAEAKEAVGREEELGDRAIRSSVDLSLQIL